VLNAVEARDVTLAYAGTPGAAISDLSLALPSGELVIVLGPNGGGKTTLFKALIGELAPLTGSLAVGGPIAYLPQYDGSRLDFPVSVIDVVLMGTLAERKLWQRAGRDDRARAAAALERVGLAERARDTYGDLSGGQRRRVLLARTIVQNAAVIALDEPLAGVDPASADSIRATLESLRDEGRLVLVASHDVEHGRAADRVLCLNKRLIADGDPASVLTDDVLRETYASDLTVIGDQLTVVTDHCGDHSH
jgi:ABC-type Mn2+/Zn2+ transport system ATPase subunit